MKTTNKKAVLKTYSLIAKNAATHRALRLAVEAATDRDAYRIALFRTEIKTQGSVSGFRVYEVTGKTLRALEV